MSWCFRSENRCFLLIGKVLDKSEFFEWIIDSRHIQVKKGGEDNARGFSNYRDILFLSRLQNI